jgi:hypothetical protein
MDRNYLLLKLSSLTGNEVDGDLMLTLESHLPASLKRVCKYVAENKPAGHEKLLKTEVFYSFFDYKNTYKHIPLEYSNFITTNYGLLHSVELSVDELGDYVRVEQCNSFVALRLAERHEVPYYMIKEGIMYLWIPENYLEGTIRVTHYEYKSIEDFPDELEEFLIQDMLGVIGKGGQ